MNEHGKNIAIKNYFQNRLLEDEDGGVRVSAFNALEHFRNFFITFAFGGYNPFDEKEIVKLWMNSLFLLWDKTKSLKKLKKECRKQNNYKKKLKKYLKKQKKKLKKLF